MSSTTCRMTLSLLALVSVAGCSATNTTKPESPQATTRPSETVAAPVAATPVMQPTQPVTPDLATEPANIESTPKNMPSKVVPVEPGPATSAPQTAAVSPKTPKPEKQAPPPKQAAPVSTAQKKPMASSSSSSLASTPAPVDRTPASVALDLTALEQRLRETRAIGMFTKLSLKNQVDDLLAAFRDYYRGQSKIALTELRQRYDLLLMKLLSLLQDSDQALASAIVSSREAIWDILRDPKKFAQI